MTEKLKAPMHPAIVILATIGALVAFLLLLPLFIRLGRFLWPLYVTIAVYYLIKYWLYLQRQPRQSPTPAGSPPAPRRRTVADCAELLGVARDARREEIQHAYRQMMQQYHPDRVAHLGPELRAVAEAKSREINEAYEQLLRAAD